MLSSPNGFVLDSSLVINGVRFPTSNMKETRDRASILHSQGSGFYEEVPCLLPQQ